jgi:hypothetical protein
MRAEPKVEYEEESKAPLVPRERTGFVVIAAIVAVGLIVLALFLSVPDGPATPADTAISGTFRAETAATPAQMPAAVTDSATAAANASTDFTQRQLGETRVAVGISDGPVGTGNGNEATMVIDGPLLEELEAEAEEATVQPPAAEAQ